MSKLNRILPLCVLAAAASSAVQASDFSYDYVGLAYVSAEVDDVNIDGNGMALEGSFSVADNYHVVAHYTDIGFDYNIDGKTFDLGLGYNRSISEAVDVVASVSYVSVELSEPTFGSVDDNGYGVYLGLRGMVADKVELLGGLNYVNLSDSGNDTTYSLGAGFDVTDQIQIGAGLSNNSDGNSYNIGVRFYFGK